MSENELLFSLFFVSCRSKNKVEQPMIKDFDLLQRANNDYTTIDLEHAEELAYRELIDSIRYIPLGDECGVMGNIANIITYKGRFYIQEEQFDRVFSSALYPHIRISLTVLLHRSATLRRRGTR